MALEEIEKLKERLAKDPSSKLFVPLAEEYRKAGMFDEAIEVLKNGLESQPSYMSARVSLGKIYLEKDMIEEAMAEFEQVTKAIPDNLFAHKKLAEIYKELGDPIKAVQRYELVLKLNPLDEDAKINLESLSGTPVSDSNEAPTEALAPVEPAAEQASSESKPLASPTAPVSTEPGIIPEEPMRVESEPALAPPQPRSSRPEDVPPEPVYVEPEPGPVPPKPVHDAQETSQESAGQSHPEPEPVTLESESVNIEPEPVSAQVGGAALDQTPVEMSLNDENESKLEDMLMHEEIKAEAADMGTDFHQFRHSFSSDLREKESPPGKPKDDTPMYYMGEEPGAPQPEEREVPNEMHPFARFTENPGSSAEDDMSAQDLSEETLASVPVIDDNDEIPEVSLSEDELEEIEAGYPEGGEIEDGFDAIEEEDAVPEITLSESEIKEAAFPGMSENFSLHTDNDAVVAPEIPVVPDAPAEPITSFTREESSGVPPITEEKRVVPPQEASVSDQLAGPGVDTNMLQALKRAETYIDAGDFVQAVQYYDILLEKFPGERRILQKLEELRTYLKITGKDQEMVVQKMEILLKGIQQRKNEFFGSA